MARSSNKSSGKSKIRFIMLEAELADGDLSEVTEAIQNALKPKSPQMIIQSLTSNPAELPDDRSIDDIDIVLDGDDDESDVNDAPSKRKKTTYRSPKVVEIEFDSNPSLVEFVAKYPPETVRDKHLVVLAWAKEGGDAPALSTDQVYTAFRHLNWSAGQKDFSQPLRDLKKHQLINGNAKEGFEINHIGFAKVEKFGQNG